jgi:hypothetical protein
MTQLQGLASRVFNRRIHRRTALLAGGSAAFLVACGGDDDKDQAAAPTAGAGATQQAAAGAAAPAGQPKPGGTARYPMVGISSADPPTIYPFENLTYLAQIPGATTTAACCAVLPTRTRPGTTSPSWRAMSPPSCPSSRTR